ncbi:MAG: DUF1592 domain-containing protein [Marinagarivorans sp.]|nr:DUF1592 domain-containing protein [Marinagarivorans sp.]
MKKFLTLGLLSATLVGCGGTTDLSSSSSNSSGIKSSSSIAKSSSSATLSSSSVKSSSSAVISSSSKAASSSSVPVSTFDGNPANGKVLIENTSGNCFVCHEDGNHDGFFEAKANSNGIDVNNFEYPSNPTFSSGNYTGTSVEDLARFIDERMPNAGTCNGQCAEDIAAYLWSLRGKEVVVGPTSCVSPDPVNYGRRSLKFLTSYEYQNSLQALFNKPLPADYSSNSKIASDVTVAGLPNHTYAKINEGRLNSYDSNATDISRWATKTAGALSFSWSETTKAATAASFLSEFAYPAFRRPLTAEEKNEYTAIITGANSVEAGLQWAIRSALMSPQFLYRSELGLTKTQMLTALNAAPERVVYEPAATPISLGGSGTNIKSPADAGYTFTGNDLIVVKLSATPVANTTNVYPGLKLNLAGTQPLPVNRAGPVTLTFHVKGTTGPVYYIAYDKVYNTGQYGGDHTIIDVSVAPAKIKDAPNAFKAQVTAADADAYVLDDFEYASALAFALTGSAPDTELLEATYNGDLSTPETLEYQVDRLINSAKGKEQVGRFAGLWFATDGVINVNRFGNDKFTNEVKNSMAQEIREMYKHVFYDESQSYKSLFEADYTMLNKTLSDFYGMPGATGDTFVKVSTAGTKRGGLIASGAFMALYAHDDRTSPIRRAVHVRQDMLCQSIPQPGALNDGDARLAAAAVAQARQEAGDLTTTDFYDIQTNVPGTSCSVCHNAVINPLFAMDDFNNVGLPRDIVNGMVVQKGLGANGKTNVPVKMVNDGGFLYSGDIVGGVDTTIADDAKATGNGIPFKGAKQLSKALVANDLPGVDACLVQKTYRFALGSPIRPSDVDARYEPSLSTKEKGQMLCVKDNLEKALGANSNPKAMLKKLVLSDVLRFRR